MNEGDKIHLIISIDAEKEFDKIKMKIHKKLEVEGNVPDLINSTMESSQLASYLVVRDWMRFP